MIWKDLKLYVIKNEAKFNEESLRKFNYDIKNLVKKGNWDKNEILRIFKEIIPDFNHEETGKHLDQKM